MATCVNLPDLTLNMKEDVNNVFQLLEIIKPGWNKDNVTVKLLPNGASNHMVWCSHDSGESITVRVRNTMDGLRDHELERTVVKTLSSKGDFPPVLATFKNGFCYEYVPGSTYFQKEFTEFDVDEKMLRIFARQLANIHTTHVAEFDYSKTPFYDFYFELLSQSKPWFEGCPSIEELEEEIRIVVDLVSKVGSPLVLCHGDIHAANIVWNEELDKMTFMDWELTQIAPRASDIAYFLNSLYNIGMVLEIPVTTPDDVERKLCQSYLERYNELKGLPSPTSEELDQLLLELKHFVLVINLIMMVYFVKFDVIMASRGNVQRRWQHYLNRYLNSKDELFGMKKLGRPSA